MSRERTCQWFGNGDTPLSIFGDDDRGFSQGAPDTIQERDELAFQELELAPALISQGNGLAIVIVDHAPIVARPFWRANL